MTGQPGTADLARLRQGLYRFFAGALLPPDGARLRSLRQAAALLDRMGVDGFAFALPWQELRREMARLPPEEELAAQHVHLFQSGASEALCPPVESYYRGGGRAGAAGLSASELGALYARHGLRFAKGRAYVEDEATPQLELMAHLCATEAEAAERGDERRAALGAADQEAFLASHLGQWFPSFAARVAATGNGGFYRALVAAAAAFVDHDGELIAALRVGAAG